MCKNDNKNLAIFKGAGQVDYIVPEGTKTIEECAFQSREDLINIIIPNGVTHIELCAFEGCKNVVNVVLPDSLVYI